MKINNNYVAVTNRDVISTYWQSLKKRAWFFYVSIVMIILASVMELTYPIFYKKFFDVLTVSSPNPITANSLVHIILIILGAHIVAWVGWRISTFATIRYQVETMSDIKTNAFEYIAGHSQTFFANTFIGSLVQRVSRAAKAFETIFDNLSWNLIPLIVQIVGYTIVLSIEKPLFAVLIVSWGVLFIAFNFFFARYKMKYDVKKSEADSRTTGALADALTNHTTINLFTGYDFENSRFVAISNDQAKITSTSWNLGWIVEAIQSAFIMAIEFLVFYFGIKLWRDGQMSMGTFVLIQVYVISLSGSLWNFGKVIRGFYEAFADGVELVQILKTPHDIDDAPQAGTLTIENGSVEFRDVCFEYGNGRMVLDHLNIRVKAGERVALVGSSGAGKTTVMSLLLRFHDVTSGAVLIDGVDIRTVTQTSLHHAIAMVPQDTVLFHRTLRENIRYGRIGANDEEVERAAHLAHCTEFIGRLPLGYDTYVGERGVKLSGGERQRVAIARAILKHAPLLVLDEATSSLDSESEALIQDALGKVMEGRTTIVIAHRLSTIRKMDRIIVLDSGRVAEEGTHDELIQNPNSHYKKLWDLQAGGFMGGTIRKNEQEEEEKIGNLDDEEDDDVIKHPTV